MKCFMKCLLVLFCTLTLIAVAADPQAALRAEQQARARAIAGETGEATRAYAPYRRENQPLQPFTPLYEPVEEQTDARHAKAA